MLKLLCAQYLQSNALSSDVSNGNIPGCHIPATTETQISQKPHPGTQFQKIMVSVFQKLGCIWTEQLNWEHNFTVAELTGLVWTAPALSPLLRKPRESQVVLFSSKISDKYMIIINMSFLEILWVFCVILLNLLGYDPIPFHCFTPTLICPSEQSDKGSKWNKPVLVLHQSHFLL